MEDKKEVMDQEETQEEEKLNVFQKTWRGLKSFGQFIGENPALLMPIMSGLGGIFFGGISMLAKNGRRYDEMCEVEDDFTGETLKVTHPLTNSEILEMSSQMELHNQSKAEALRDMGLLKDEKRRR